MSHSQKRKQKLEGELGNASLNPLEVTSGEGEVLAIVTGGAQ